MVRVTTEDEVEMVRLKIEGRLAGTDVNNVQAHWQTITATREHSSILIDLTGVTFVDEGGKKLLAEMNRQGNKFVASGLLTRAILEEVSQDS